MAAAGLRPIVSAIVKGAQHWLGGLKCFLFSDGVSEAYPLDRIAAGHWPRSSGGTSFDSVVEHLHRLGGRRALVFTDGGSDVSSSLRKELRRRQVSLRCVLFNNEHLRPHEQPFWDWNRSYVWKPSIPEQAPPIDDTPF